MGRSRARRRPDFYDIETPAASQVLENAVSHKKLCRLVTIDLMPPRVGAFAPKVKTLSARRCAKTNIKVHKGVDIADSANRMFLTIKVSSSSSPV